MVTMGQLWANTSSALATLMFVYTIFKQWFPHVGDHLEPFFQRLFSRFYPYIQITFHEYSGEHFKRSEAYLGSKAISAKTLLLEPRSLKPTQPKEASLLSLAWMIKKR